MTGAELKRMRLELGFDGRTGRADFARELGYTGNDNTLAVRWKKYEHGKEVIPGNLAQLVWLYYQVVMERPIPISGTIVWPPEVFA